MTCTMMALVLKHLSAIDFANMGRVIKQEAKRKARLINMQCIDQKEEHCFLIKYYCTSVPCLPHGSKHGSANFHFLHNLPIACLQLCFVIIIVD